ncbi:cold-shock protein [Mycolicibacterium grossiae]|uniref:Cold-shock protein n=2 Tax=Mycolicibacterium grossiae TaxID=1552759 RepID=A0A1E8Q774_9MYCO|nr:cold-shock protein [Mycolicibacterium grossiae]
MPSPRALPSLLFSAVLASVVMLPMALDGLPDGTSDREVDPLILVEKPLDGVGGGETVRDVTQDTPFSVVALTGTDMTGTSAKVRAKEADGSWGPWYEADRVDGGGDGPSATDGTEPVFVGKTTHVQIAVTRPVDAPTGATGTHPGPGKGLGYLPATVEQPTAPTFNAVLISPPTAPVDVQFEPPAAVSAPGQAPAIIDRAHWGADERLKCGNTVYDNGVRAGVVHHTAGSNDYSPEDSAGIVRSIYEYHTRTLGWCDMAYNALVDKYGQVFEGRAGGITRPVQGAHTGGFNANTWGVAMMGDFETVPPTPIQLRTTGRLLGWRLGMDHVDPKGTVVLTSAGGDFTHFPRGAAPTLPTIFAHRDVGNTECPGNAAYAEMDLLRDTAAKFSTPPGPQTLADALRGGAIFAKWASQGGEASPLGAPLSPEAAGEGDARYVNFRNGAMYWSPVSGAQPVTGVIYDAWATLGFERGALGLPTSGEIQEPLWIVQNFQHGTLNFDREKGTVTRVIDGVPLELPKPANPGKPVQLERFTPIDLASASR